MEEHNNGEDCCDDTSTTTGLIWEFLAFVCFNLLSQILHLGKYFD
jgi:hypothetical protein